MCRWVMRSQAYLGVLQHRDGLLSLTTHHYADEVVPEEDLEFQRPALPRGRAVAGNLVQELTERSSPGSTTTNTKPNSRPGGAEGPGQGSAAAPAEDAQANEGRESRRRPGAEPQSLKEMMATTQVQNAEMLCEHCGERFRYDEGRRCWTCDALVCPACMNEPPGELCPECRGHDEAMPQSIEPMLARPRLIARAVRGLGIRIQVGRRAGDHVLGRPPHPDREPQPRERDLPLSRTARSGPSLPRRRDPRRRDRRARRAGPAELSAAPAEDARGQAQLAAGPVAHPDPLLRLRPAVLGRRDAVQRDLRTPAARCWRS